jgi:HSP20 family protein
MDQLFDTFWTIPATTREMAWQSADIEENDDHYLLTLEMPGIPRDRIKIECVDNQLSISAEKSTKTGKSQPHMEQRLSRFSRCITLPVNVNADKIEADYQDGVLRLYVPKAESAKPKLIKISNGGATGFFGKLLGKPKEKAEETSTSDPKPNKVA